MRCNKNDTTWFPGSGHVVVSQYFLFLYIIHGVPYNEQCGQHMKEEQVQGETKLQEDWLATMGEKEYNYLYFSVFVLDVIFLDAFKR